MVTSCPTLDASQMPWLICAPANVGWLAPVKAGPNKALMDEEGMPLAQLPVEFHIVLDPFHAEVEVSAACADEPLDNNRASIKPTPGKIKFPISVLLCLVAIIRVQGLGLIVQRL